MLKRMIQIMFLLIGGTLGLVLLPPLFSLIHLSDNPWINNPYVSVLLGAIVLFVVSLFVADYFVKLLKWMEERLLKVPSGDVLFGTLGLIIGLLLAYLVSVALSSIRIPVFLTVIPILVSIILGYLGFQVGFKRREELMSVFSSRAAKKKQQDVKESTLGTYKLLDTSVIIDGRIADICRTGFVEGTLVIPQFVLTELQHIADSSDTLKRTKGRRGLDILKTLQKEYASQVLLTEVDFEDVPEVDLKLVRLAKKMDGQVVTNDFNLNKVCELHKVKVLNINDLANAVKPVVIPGEEMHVVVIKEGKEHNQGVAYLDDGTMIVVEDGKTYIGDAITVVVTSVLQTSAGRMIFAKKKKEKENG
ncbi:PIN/TRAM domain-containing protein [Kurthia senegalensis]|uniref:PIN/TRAM domain-containing protein n=1 Tax=Kurthia senegalensis TaxID=1033740 RepID=UPI000289FE27|nr:PIN/TRAM domain-containing protein [Kurthia senegalensis]